ncbi:MAG: eukaryotic-like serine/threonine-protein kinase, partial [Myxococcales bacterium]|nr:eukaryotic-like serine/threonine-protein kinase [Myxococcales bacterium]
MVGQTLGNYRIVAKLGNGAMGQVFLAEHQRIVRRVAIKVLNQDLTTNPRSVARFLDEARATSLIRHPGIVEVFDCDVDPSGRVYLVMEYLEGKTLASRLQEQHRLPWPMACQVTRQMAVALGAAHEKGIIHRDIKPENVFLSVAADRPQELVVRVLDFGIAKLLSGDPVDGARTIPGMLVGTPDYMAPEQCGGTEPVDQRADIYALGCVLFRMVSGRLPFIASNFRDVMAAHMFRMPPPLGPVDPPTPRWLNDLVGRMLAKEPSERPASMDEVAHSLARASERTSASGAPRTSIELSIDVSGAKVSAAA